MGITEATRSTRAAVPALVGCPACGQTFVWPPTGPCAHCGADLTGPVAMAIFDLDREAGALQVRRQAFVDELRATGSKLSVADLPPPTTEPAAAVARTATPPRRSRLRPQTFLAAAGAVLLLVAVIVFIAVTWPTWPAAGQVAFVSALTIVGAVAARATATRGLPATADAVGVLTTAVAGYSLLAAHAEGIAGLDRIDTALWVTGVAAVVAVAARPFTTWAGLRDAVRRLAVLAAVVAAGSLMVWLADVVVVAEPHLVLLAVAPTIAVVLLAHGRWALRPGDWANHVARVAPAGLLVGAAASTGVLGLTDESAVAAALAAAVGLPLLVWVRQRTSASAWSSLGAVVATLWVAQLATLYLTDVGFGALGIAMPELVTFTAAATTILVVARLRPPPEHWRQPVLVAGAVAAIPAVLWMVSTWMVAASLVAEALQAPFTGWPASDAPTATDMTLSGAALVVGALLVERLRREWVRPAVMAGGGAALLAIVVAGAAGGIMPTAAPLALAAVASGGAAVWWQRDPARWPVVTVTHSAALVLAVVDLDLFAIATSVVAAHLLWMATRRGQPVTAAAGVASGLAAIAATSQTWDWPVAATTLLVTVVAGAVLVLAQLVAAEGLWRHTATDVVVALSFVGTTTAATVADEPTTVAVQLAVVAIVAAVHAARPGRGWAVWLSSAAATAAIWVLLGERGVDVVEAYTLPAAVALAAAGAWRLHVTPTSSWAALGPACTMASVPTLVVLLDGPDPIRVLLLASGAVAVALVGHWRRLAAPLAVGAVVAMLTAVMQLHYWTAYLPRWVTFAVLGAVLIWASATYEAQLRRSRNVREHLQQLR